MNVTIDMSHMKADEYDVTLVDETGSDPQAVVEQILVDTKAAMNIPAKRISICVVDNGTDIVLSLFARPYRPRCVGATVNALKASLELAGHTVTLNETDPWPQVEKDRALSNAGMHTIFDHSSLNH